MKITKYQQSCLVIESEGKKLLIDPGSFFAQNNKAEDFLDVSAVLLTHTHADHFDKNILRIFFDNEIPIYGNSDVAQQLETVGIKCNEVKDRNRFTIENFEIEPVDLPHCKLRRCKVCKASVWNIPSGCKEHPNKVDVVDGPLNTGFLVNRNFFHPGDGVEIEGFEVKNTGVAIVGPTISYSDAWAFVRQIRAKTVVPMHYTHPAFIDRGPKEFAKLAPENTRVIILGDGESAEI